MGVGVGCTAGGVVRGFGVRGGGRLVGGLTLEAGGCVRVCPGGGDPERDPTAPPAVPPGVPTPVDPTAGKLPDLENDPDRLAAPPASRGSGRTVTCPVSAPGKRGSETGARGGSHLNAYAQSTATPTAATPTGEGTVSDQPRGAETTGFEPLVLSGAAAEATAPSPRPGVPLLHCCHCRLGRRLPTSDADQPALVRPPGRSGPIRHAELPVDVREMGTSPFARSPTGAPPSPSSSGRRRPTQGSPAHAWSARKRSPRWRVAGRPRSATNRSYPPAAPGESSARTPGGQQQRCRPDVRSSGHRPKPQPEAPHRSPQDRQPPRQRPRELRPASRAASSEAHAGRPASCGCRTARVSLA